MKKRLKKGSLSMQQLAMYSLVVAVFLILLGVAATLHASQSKQMELTQCAGQLSLATQGNPVSFNECQPLSLRFENDSAKKCIGFSIDDANVYEDYVYSDVLDLLKNQGIVDKSAEIKNNVIPEEVVYYILSEEIRFCFDVYTVPQMKTFTKFTKETGTMCHTCSLISFDGELFFSDELKISKLNSFFINIHPEDESTNYLDYVKTRFSFLEDVNQPLFKPDTIISKNNLYSISHIYTSLTDKQRKNIKKDSKYYVKSSHVALINRQYVSDVCHSFLLFAPSKISYELKDYSPLLGESVLYLI